MKCVQKCAYTAHFRTTLVKKKKQRRMTEKKKKSLSLIVYLYNNIHIPSFYFRNLLILCTVEYPNVKKLQAYQQ